MSDLCRCDPDNPHTKRKVWYCEWYLEKSTDEPKTEEKKNPVADTEYIQQEARGLVELLGFKNSDYAPAGEFSNFEEAAKLAGVLPIDAILIQIGIKYSRLMSLAEGGLTPKNESIKDTFRDLAGYSLIAAAYLTSRENADHE